MAAPVNPKLDLTLSRIIAAPPSTVWNAFADPSQFEKWWVPAPALSKVVAMELRPGGAFTTLISEDGGEFSPHMDGCILHVEAGERLVFTNALVSDWRPAEQPFMTASISLREHSAGTEYFVHVMHRNTADRDTHESLGFYDGWGTVTEQLATLAEASR